MKRIVGIVEPLSRKQEVAQICYGLSRWFDYVIADGLCGVVVVSECETRAAPRFAANFICFPRFALVWFL